MKTITIGRDANCTICINDDRISRRHALIRIHNWGKMEIVDLSSNGTYVNGIKLAKNVPFPVTRKNLVVFSHARQLDWNDVPDPVKHLKIILLSLTSLIVLAIVVAFSMKACNKNNSYDSDLTISNAENQVIENSNNSGNSVDESTNHDDQKQEDFQPGSKEKEGAQKRDSLKKKNSWYNSEIQKAAAEKKVESKTKKDSTTSSTKKDDKPKQDKKKQQEPTRRQIFIF